MCREQDYILWYVNDLNSSHVDPTNISIILADIDAEHGKVSIITIKRCKVHKHLKTTIDYSWPGKIIFSIIDYIGKILDGVPEDMKGESATPSALHIFDIAEDATKLYQANANLFHHFVAKILYLSERERPDIHLALYFLYTIVRGPDTDDYKKLERAMKYIKRTIGLPLILSIEKLGNIKWYIDAVFVVQMNMMSQTGGFMTIVIGGAYVQYIKQNLNTKSSTEAKLVGVDDVLTQVI